MSTKNIFGGSHYTHRYDYDDFVDDYDSSDEMKIELVDNDEIQTYPVPYKPVHSNKKRLICFSILNNELCNYGSHCTYAHSLSEQIIDPEKKFIYQIILDKNLMNFFSMTNPKTDEIYKQLLFLTHICDNCCNQTCTGGYNCRNGVFSPSLKLCRNDLLTGQCLNKIIHIDIDKSIIDKIDEIQPLETYTGCMNGHHLSARNLLPYYKYVHQKENTRKNQYQSVRYIDINSFYRSKNSDKYIHDDNSDSSIDEEINSWFKKKDDSDDSDSE